MLNYSSYQRWMENLPELKTIIPINYISIPGTHNSFTYSITSKSSFSPDAEKIVKIFGRCSKSLICNWARTQRLNAYHQLNEGIRYFDIRLAVNDDNSGNIYSCHALYSNPIVYDLELIKIFLLENDKEIVILDFNHFYNFENKHHIGFCQTLKSIFADLLVPYTTHIPSLAQLWRENKRIVIFYHYQNIVHDIVWPGYLIPSPWPNTDNETFLLQFLDKNYKEYPRSSDKFLVTQCVLTPTWKTICRYLFRSLESSLSKSVTPKLLNWLSRLDGNTNQINCVTVDFFHNGDFVSKVIDLNYRNIHVIEK